MAIFMAGCATAPAARIRYSNPTGGYEQFTDLSYKCGEFAKRVISKAQVNAYGEFAPEESVVDCGKFNTCMVKRGYTKSPEGEFLTPKGLPLDCK
ncbi:MAG TPA: hypothetical protein VIE17_05840 [Methylophilaceae bacterium]|jgi:hypothetical protein